MIGVVLVGVLAPDVMLFIHVRGILLGLVASTLAIIFIHAWYQVSRVVWQNFKWADHVAYPWSPPACQLHRPRIPRAAPWRKRDLRLCLLHCQLERVTEIACRTECSITLFALMVLVKLETLEGSTTGNELVGELGFIVWVVIAPALVVDLVVSVFRFS